MAFSIREKIMTKLVDVKVLKTLGGRYEVNGKAIPIGTIIQVDPEGELPKLTRLGAVMLLSAQVVPLQEADKAISKETEKSNKIIDKK